MQAGNDLLQAIFGLLVLFGTVLCIIPSALTLVEVQRLRKKVNETSLQSSSIAKQRPRRLCPTADFGIGYERLSSWRRSPLLSESSATEAPPRSNPVSHVVSGGLCNGDVGIRPDRGSESLPGQRGWH